MTIPFGVMVASVIAWFLLVVIPFKESSAGLQSWAKDVCRILFAVSALVVIYGAMNKTAF